MEHYFHVNSECPGFKQFWRRNYVSILNKTFAENTNLGVDIPWKDAWGKLIIGIIKAHRIPTEWGIRK